MKIEFPKIKITEAQIVDRVVQLGPWLAPVPSAWFVSDACRQLLDTPPLVAWIIAVVIEVLALVASHTALTFYDWNQRLDYDESEKWRAPIEVTMVFGGLYLVVTIILTVVLKSVPTLAAHAPILFPPLSLAGVVLLALNRTHKRRVAAKDELDTEAKHERKLAGRRKERHELKLEKARLQAETAAPVTSQTEMRVVTPADVTAFMADARSGVVMPAQMTGQAIGDRYGVSGSTGRRWKRDWLSGDGRGATI